MDLYLVTKKETVTFEPDDRIAVGGEGVVYRLADNKSWLAKIYHNATAIQARKLLAMVANPPKVERDGDISIAWPIDLLTVGQAKPKVVGFLMPRAAGCELFSCLNPTNRQKDFPEFTYATLHRVAFNLAGAVSALHQAGYVVGDVNERNVIVDRSSKVTLIDTDTFQIPDPDTGHFYRCGVGSPDFTPPELHKVQFSQIDRTPDHDNFGLATLIFYLLMEGHHPFAGISQGELGKSLYERIAARAFPYSQRSKLRSSPPKFSPPFDVLHPKLRELFLRCFDDEGDRRMLRPEARDWQEAIFEASQCLRTCSFNDQHSYGKHLHTCPWCDRKNQLDGYDSFSTQSSTQAGTFRQVLDELFDTEALKKPFIPDSLADALKSNRCVLFVGCGLSAWAGMPTWTELLWIMVNKLFKERPDLPKLNGLPDLMAKGKFQDVADFCKKELDAWTFSQILTEQLRRKDISTPEPHRLIMDLPFFAIITTNYDKLLEQAYSSLSKGNIPRVATHRDTEALGTLLSGDPGFILKAHGDIDATEGIIFTSNDYRRMIHSNSAFQMLFNAILMSKMVLFVGYSLSDPDFRFLLDGHFAAFNGAVPKRYALMSDVSDIEQSNLYDKANIQVLPYAEHVDLLDFFARLKRLVGPGSF